MRYSPILWSFFFEIYFLWHFETVIRTEMKMKKSTITKCRRSFSKNRETPPLVPRHLPEQFAYLDLLCAVFETPLVNLVDSLPSKLDRKNQRVA